MLASDILTRLETSIPKEAAFENDLIGLISGDPNRDVNTIGLSWAGTRDTLSYFGYLTGQQRAMTHEVSVPEMLIMHEYPFFEETSDYFPGIPLFSKTANSARIKALMGQDACVYVVGSSLDEAEGGTADFVARALQINVDSKLKAGRVGNIDGITFMQMLQNVKNIFGLEVVRYVASVGSTSERVSRIGCFVGNGLRNYDVIEQMHLRGAEVIISSGLSDRAGVYASELGIKLIDVERKKLESPAMKLLSKWIESNFKDRLNVISYDCDDIVFYA